MISYLTGKIISSRGQSVTLLTSCGVGYEIHVTPQLFLDLEVGSEANLHIFFVARENNMELFGFLDLKSKDLFMKFLDVNGVGPKSALHLLSLGTVEEITAAIARSDIDYLTKVSGIGKRTAERIVVELKSKVSASGIGNDKSKYGEKLSEVIDALVSLGYHKDEARQVVKGLNEKGKTSEELLKESLQAMSR